MTLRGNPEQLSLCRNRRELSNLQGPAANTHARYLKNLYLWKRNRLDQPGNLHDCQSTTPICAYGFMPFPMNSWGAANIPQQGVPITIDKEIVEEQTTVAMDGGPLVNTMQNKRVRRSA